MDVAFVEAVGAEELGDIVHALGLHVHFLLHFLLGGESLFRGEGFVLINVCEGRGEVGKDEGIRVVRAEEFPAHFHEVGLV